MPTLYSWSVRRAGAGMSITHSCGKIVNVQSIEVLPSGQVVATKEIGQSFILHVG